jgi:hypothetical protein
MLRKLLSINYLLFGSLSDRGVVKNHQAKSLSTSVLKIARQFFYASNTIFAMPVVTVSQIFLYAIIAAESV